MSLNSQSVVSDLSDREDSKKLQEGIDKDLKELFSTPKKMLLIIIGISIFVALFSSQGGINEDWARNVAGSIITAGGLLLGFFILGVTSFSRKEFVRAVHEALIRKHIKTFLESARSYQPASHDNVQKFINEEIMLAVGRTGFSMGVMQGVFYGSVRYLLISIGAAFCLYGVHGSYAYGSMEYIIFDFFEYLSLACLFLAAYTLLKNIGSLLDRSTETYTRDTYDLIMKILDEKLEEDERRKKPSNERNP